MRVARKVGDAGGIDADDHVCWWDDDVEEVLRRARKILDVWRAFLMNSV